MSVEKEEKLDATEIEGVVVIMELFTVAIREDVGEIDK